MQVTCYYDYTCPYSYKAFLWLESLQAAGENLEVAWSSFSLKEANRNPARPSVLDTPKAESVSVLALALAQAARGARFDRYHRAVFRAMHAEHRRLREADLFALAGDAGVDNGAFDADPRRWLSALAAEHREGRPASVSSALRPWCSAATLWSSSSWPTHRRRAKPSVSGAPVHSGPLPP